MCIPHHSLSFVISGMSQLLLLEGAAHLAVQWMCPWSLSSIMQRWELVGCLASQCRQHRHHRLLLPPSLLVLSSNEDAATRGFSFLHLRSANNNLIPLCMDEKFNYNIVTFPRNSPSERGENSVEATKTAS